MTKPFDFSEKPYILHCGLAENILPTFESESVSCVISSPPYFGLRDYGFDEQLGLEPTYQEYLEKLWAVMDEVWRILKPTGTVFINLGDTYGTQSGAMRDGKFGAKNTNNQAFIQPKLTHKCLLMIPARFAIGCIERNWILRNDCIWHKPNGMPESVTDRFSKKHEHFFFFTKQPKYYFNLDSIRENLKTESLERYKYEFSGNKLNADREMIGTPQGKMNGYNQKAFLQPISDKTTLGETHPKGKNPGDVFVVNTKPNSTEHYASYNLELIEKPMKAGCEKGGIVLDMFCGTSTTGVSALIHGNKFVGIDGSAEYLKIAERNLRREKFETSES